MTGNKKFGFYEGGFTFIELLLVLAILGLLASLTTVVALGKVRQSKESALKEDLHLMRKGIDDFYADTGKYPKKLEDMVDRRYLRAIPEDPFTERNDNWQPVYAKDPAQKEGIEDVHSGSDEKSSDGGSYSEW
jgi:general secretion pathway protein G